MKNNLINLTYVLLISLIPSLSMAELHEKDKAFINHLQRYYTTGWSRVDTPGATTEARKVFSLHWKKYHPMSGIGVINISEAVKNSRRIIYYYKQPASGTIPKAFEANIVRNEDNGEYLIMKVLNTNYPLSKLLDNNFHNNYRTFKKLFKHISHDKMNLASKGKLISPETLQVINKYLSRDEYFALYKFNYEKNIVAYLIKTPTCYGTSNTGTSLYLFREINNTENIEKKEDSHHYESAVEISESNCGDAGESWETEGLIIDINNDGFLDVLRKQSSRYYDNEKNIQYPQNDRYEKFIYSKNGKFSHYSISKENYENIINKAQ